MRFEVKKILSKKKEVHDEKGKKIFLVLLLAVVVANTKMTGFAKNSFFHGENTIKVGQGTFKTTVKRGKQVSGDPLSWNPNFSAYGDFQWDFNFSAKYDGPKKVESISSACYVITQEKSTASYPVSGIITRVKSFRVETKKNDPIKNFLEQSFVFRSDRGEYVQGTIKAEVVSNLKLRGNPQTYRVVAGTKSKKKYDHFQSNLR